MLSAHYRIALAALALSPTVLGQGASAHFESESHVFLDQNSRAEYPADLDGDGQMEMVGWWSYWSNYNPIQVFFLTQDSSTGLWVEKEDTFGSGSSAYRWGVATSVGDFDGDGKDEMINLHHWAIEVFEPAANGEPKRIVDQTFSPGISALDRDSAVLDFDGDGRDDVVLTAGHEVFLFRSIPGGFLRVDTFLTTGGDLSVVTADVQGDAGLEIVVLQERVLPNVHVFDPSSGALGTPTTYLAEAAVGGPAPDDVDIAEGDVDGDGDTDLVLFGMAGYYQVLRNEIDGLSFEAPTVGGPATDLADVDADGDLDGVCCGGGGGGNFLYNTEPTTFHICLNDGTGSFDNAVGFPGIGARHVGGTIDFDGDGDLDVMAGRAVLINYGTVGTTYCDGVPNSTGQPAVLTASARHSVAMGGPTMTANDLPPSSVALLLGTKLTVPGPVLATPFWDGTLCLGGFQARLKIAGSNANGVADFGNASGWNSVFGMGTSPDEQHLYQVWYRDTQAGQTGANLSSATRVLLVQ